MAEKIKIDNQDWFKVEIAYKALGEVKKTTIITQEPTFIDTMINYCIATKAEEIAAEKLKTLLLQKIEKALNL